MEKSEEIDIKRKVKVCRDNCRDTFRKECFNIASIGAFGTPFVGGMLAATGKSLSEALIFASTNPQYDDRLFIELKVKYMKIPNSNLGRTCFVQKLFLTFRKFFFTLHVLPMSAKKKSF